MKTLSVLLKITIAFVFAVCLSLNLVTGKAWAVGQFGATCKDVSVSSSTELASIGEPSLSAACQKSDGSYIPASIKLNPYLGADKSGVLSWGSQNVGLKCYDFAVSDKNLLGAKCFNYSQRNSEDVTTSINLNEHIVNINGKLQYE